MSAFLFFISFLYYLAGLSGTVPAYRDSGDLIASIHTLGIAHPPGYALYILLGKVFVTILPFGNVAYRVNVMSAVFAALTVAVFYRVACKVTGGQRMAALLVSALFLAAPAVTTLARVAEMYTLSALITGLILLCLLSDDPNGPSWAALLLGLGLSVHLTLIFLVPLFLVTPSKTISRSSVICFVLGLCIFLYLPVRAAQDPLVNWGDPSSWRNFWRVVTRADYGGLKLHPQESVLSWTPMQFAQQGQYFFKSFVRHWSVGGVLLGCFGLFMLLRDAARAKWTAALMAVWILSGPAFFILSNLPQTETSTAILEPYLIVPMLVWGLFTAAGVAAFMSRTTAHRFVIAIVAVVALGAKSWAWESSRHDFYAYDYARNVLRTLPKEAVLYDPDDTTHFSLQVVQLLEKRRPDVMLLSFFRTRWGYEQLKQRWPEFLPPVPMRNGQELQRAIWEYSARKYPFFAELPLKFNGLPNRSHGLLYAHAGAAEALSSAATRTASLALLDSAPCRGMCTTSAHHDFFIRHVLGYYAAARCNLGLEYASHKDWKEAVALYEQSLAIDPELSAAWNNWGIALYERGDYAAAAKLFQRALQFDPNNEMLQKNAQLAFSRK